MAATNAGNRQQANDETIITPNNPQDSPVHLLQPHMYRIGHETLQSCIRQAREQGDGRGSGSDELSKFLGKSSYPLPPLTSTNKRVRGNGNKGGGCGNESK